MSQPGETFSSKQQLDAIDSYFECIVACSLEGDTMECVSNCVSVHLKGEDDM